MNTENQSIPAGFIPALRFHALTRLYDPLVRLTTRELSIKRRLVAGLGQGVQSILDLGSGTGTLLELARPAYPAARLVGLDSFMATRRILPSILVPLIAWCRASSCTT